MQNASVSSNPKSISTMIEKDEYVMFNQANISIIENAARKQNKLDIIQKAEDFQKYLTNIKGRINKSFEFAELVATELLIFGLNKINKDDYVAAAKALISSNPYSSTPPSALVKQLVRALVSAFFVRINDHDVLLQFIKELESEDIECYLHCQFKRQIKIFTEDEMKQKSFTNIAIEIPSFLNEIIEVLDKSKTKVAKNETEKKPRSPICEAIIKDDVESLKSALESSQPIDFLKYKIEFTSNERCIFPKKIHPHQKYKQEKTNKPTLLEYAAFYGSENCFKYLYNEKKCKITKNIPKHTLCGGNNYIYETVLSAGKSFIDDLEYAIKFHHKELFQKCFLSYYSEYGTEKNPYDVVQKKYSTSCIKFFSFEILRFLIEFGVDVSDCMINQAIKRDIHSLFIFLLGLNVDVNKQDSSDFAAIHCAIRSGNTSAVQVLLANKKSKVDLNLGDHCGRSPIHFAAIVGNLEIFNILSNQPGVDLTRLDDEEMTPLHYAARQGKYDIVKQLITVKKIDPNCKNSAYMTPLHYACINGRLDIVRILLDVPTIDVNPHDIGNWTPLHYAIDNNNIPIVSLLLENKNINPNVIDSIFFFIIFFKYSFILFLTIQHL